MKKYDYLDENNQLTDKGILLTKLNGYEQIPIIDSVVNKEFEDMNPIQLAGVVAGLAFQDTLKDLLAGFSIIFENM